MPSAALTAALDAADTSGVSGLNPSQKETVTTQKLLEGIAAGASGATEATQLIVAANTAVQGYSVVLTPTVTVSTTPAYTAGDAVGGKLVLASAVRVSGGTGLLESIMLLDRSAQSPPLQIFIFDADPTDATIADNSPFIFGTSELKVLARIPVAAGDWVIVDGKSTATLRVLGTVFKAVTGVTLWAVIVTTGTPTFATTTAFQIRFGILQD